MKLTQHHRAGAFTLIEILVTIGIIVLVLAITFPFIQQMSAFAGGGSGINTIGVAVTAARGYAVRDRGGISPNVHKGAAILFTPSGELRLIETDLNATSASLGVYLQQRGWVGYQDIADRDYIALPRDTIVLGLARNSPGDPLVLTPPFAVRFDENGQVISGIAMDSDRVVYYDADYSGTYNTTAATGTFGDGSERRNPEDFETGSSITFSHTATPYNPDFWNVNHPKYENYDNCPGEVYNSAVQNNELPFEGIETVAALLVVSRQALSAAMGQRIDGTYLESRANTDGDLNAAAKTWVLAQNNGEFINAQPLFFSRYTGTLMRENR